MRCLLVGNYGVKNLGDEALKAYFLQAFPEVEWQVVSADGPLPRLPCGIRSLFRPWWRTVIAIARADAMVFGGGSLFTDAESWRAPLLWWLYAITAWCTRTPIILAFQGIGPLRTRIAKYCTSFAICRAAFISVRDTESFKRAREILGETGLKNKILVQSFDPAITVFKGSLHKSSKKLIIIPRANTTNEFLEKVQEEVAKGWEDIAVVLLEPEADVLAARRTKEIAGNACRIVNAFTFETLVSEVSGATVVITQRFHGAIAALANGIPFRAVPQAPGDKLDAANHFNANACQQLLKEGEEALRAFFRKP